VEEIKRQQDGPASSEIGLLCVVFLRLHSFAFGHAHVFGMDPNISRFDYDDSFQCFLQVSHPNVIPNDPNISGEALEAVVAGSCSAHGRHAAIQAWHGTLHKDASEEVARLEHKKNALQSYLVQNKASQRGRHD